MSTDTQHEPNDTRTEEEQTLPMDLQGTSYNESTPGEIIANREYVLGGAMCYTIITVTKKTEQPERDHR